MKGKAPTSFEAIIDLIRPYVILSVSVKGIVAALVSPALKLQLDYAFSVCTLRLSRLNSRGIVVSSLGGGLVQRRLNIWRFQQLLHRLMRHTAFATNPGATLLLLHR